LLFPVGKPGDVPIRKHLLNKHLNCGIIIPYNPLHSL